MTLKRRHRLRRILSGLVLALMAFAVWGAWAGRSAATRFTKDVVADLVARTARLEKLSLRPEMVTLPFDAVRGSREGLERSTTYLKGWTEKEPWVDAVWVQGADGARVFSFARNPTNEVLAALEKTNAAAFAGAVPPWVQVKGHSVLIIQQEIPSLFGSLGRILVLCLPWREAGLLSRSVLPDPAKAGLDLQIAWPGLPLHQGIGAGGWHNLYGVSFSGRQVWVDTVLPLWWLPIFALVFMALVWLIPDRRGRGMGKTAAPVLAPRSTGGIQEVAPTLRHMQRNMEGILRRLNRGDLERRLGGQGYRHLQAGGGVQVEKSAEELAREDALYANIKLPEGKKTALIEDPTVPVEIVFDFDLGERFDEVVFDFAAAAAEKEKEKNDPHKDDFAEGKTKLVEDGEPSRIAFDDKLAGNLDEIDWEVKT